MDFNGLNRRFLSATNSHKLFLLNLLNLCEPKGARTRRASVRFNTIKKIQ